MFINFVKHMPKDYKSLWIPNMRLFFGGLNGCGVFINFENFSLRRSKALAATSQQKMSGNLSYLNAPEPPLYLVVFVLLMS
jgi:hypothetical protein